MALTTIKTGGIADNAITNAKMADDAIDSADFVDGSIDLAHMSANSVDSDQYVDGSIDNVHLAGSIAVSKTLLAGGTGLTLSTNTLAVDAAQTQITSVGTLTGLTLSGTLNSSHISANNNSNVLWECHDSQSNSRSWGFANDIVAYGDFILKRSDARDNTLDTTVLSFDGSSNAIFAGNVELNSDSTKFKAGASDDITLFHNGTDSYIQAFTGDLTIQNIAASKGINIHQEGASGYVKVLTNNTLALTIDSNQYLTPASHLYMGITGSAGSPAIAFDTDADTGIYRKGTNELGFSTNGTERVYINDSLNVVGVGYFNEMIRISISDISTGENRGLQLLNTSGTDQQWNITAGVTGSENESFCIRDSTANVNALAIGINSGIATFAGQITATGIKFDGSGEVLDDYEEGTTEFSSGYTNGAGGTTTFHSAYDIIAWTRIGRVVHVQGMLIHTGYTGTNGEYRIGLPFVIGGGSTALEYRACNAFHDTNGGSGDAYTISTRDHGTSYASVVKSGVGADTTLDSGDVGSRVQFSLTYLTS